MKNLFLLLLFVCSIANALPPIRYVNASATGSNDGTSWTNAFTSLQSALDAAVSGDEIWVAKGTYKPTVLNDRNVPRSGYFQMKNGVAIYGGFAGTETLMIERNSVGNPTILSGDIGTVGDKSDNCYTIFQHPDGLELNSTAVLDGFIISDANANDTHLGYDWGGGMLNINCSPTIANCIFRDNYANAGGGLALISSSPMILNCTFSNNSADLRGGGMDANWSNPTITNCTFIGNSAAVNGGGLSIISYYSPVITNCTFSGNNAGVSGGGIYCEGASPSIKNTIFWGDHKTGTTDVSEIHVESGTPEITYCCIQGGYSGNGNLSSDPLFVDADGADNIYGTPDDVVRLQNTSPCIDAGTPVGAPANDILGFSRGGEPDIGAYEYRMVFFVDYNASGSNNGTSWSDAYTSLRTAIGATPGGYQIWVAKGTYKPTTGTDRNISFQMKNGVAIYGGLAGTETSLSQRSHFKAGETNETILSGDIGIVGVNTDNSYHVVYNPSGLGLTTSAILDGFTISGGYGNSGRGIYSNENGATIRNCTITNNTGNNGSDENGGGVYFRFGTIVLDNCIISNNTSSLNGGGLFLDNSSPSVTNCIISHNTSSNDGGGIYCYNSAPTVTNCLIHNNSSGHGGGVYLRYASTNPVFFNVTVANNTTTAGDGGGGLFAYDEADGTFTNCIFWGNIANGNPNQIYLYGGSNITLNYSCYNNSIGNGGGSFNSTNNNTTIDPKFLDAQNGNYHLSAGSSCINTGLDPASGNGVPTTDIEGRSRPIGDRTDIGTYEYEHFTRYFVNANVDGGKNDGSRWDNAYTSFQLGLTSAASGDTLWVAKGTYKPTTGTDRTAYFQMKNGVSIYGGFAGTETSISQRTDFRAGQANETILSGDIGIAGDNSDNSYHIFFHSSLSNTAVLDGFTISGGNANSDAPHSQGGGMYNSWASPTITNWTFSNNMASLGGGMSNNTQASPTITNCIFSGNIASQTGGGMFVYESSSPTVTNCIFSGNIASGIGGGMYLSSNCTPAITNCTFSGNNASTNGGGMWIASSPIVKNTIFWGDYKTGTTDVSEIFIYSGTPSFTYCCVQGGYAGTGNIGGDPLFVDADGADNIYGTSDDNLRLQDLSPCIGTGTATGAPATDILGSTRGTTPDIGAYENNLNAPLPVEITSFTANAAECEVVLNWQTATEVNNYGFEIERRKVFESVSSGVYEWTKVGFVKGNGTSNAPKEYTYTDVKLPSGKYTYRLKQVDNDGIYKYSGEAEITVAVTKEFALDQNYPNPFNPTTTIQYDIPNTRSQYIVTLRMYDIMGREVTTLVNERKEAGSYEVIFNASKLASGIYFYKLQAGNYTSVKKLIYLR